MIGQLQKPCDGSRPQLLPPLGPDCLARLSLLLLARRRSLTPLIERPGSLCRFPPAVRIQSGCREDAERSWRQILRDAATPDEKPDSVKKKKKVFFWLVMTTGSDVSSQTVLKIPADVLPDTINYKLASWWALSSINPN